jgi:phage tail sheath protein FI
MAEKIVSPGVFTRENDLSFLAQGIGEIGAAIIGPFHKGPAFVPTVVNTQSEFESIFGTPDGSYYTGYTVQNYLREAGTVTIVRVGHIGGYTHNRAFGIEVSGSAGQGGRRLLGVLHATHNGDEEVGTIGDSETASDLISSQPSASAFFISGSALGHAVSASVLPSAGNDISDVFGESPRGSKDAYVYKYFEKAATDHTNYLAESGSQVVAIELGNQVFTNDIQHASTPWIQSQLISGERHNLFKLHTLGDGTNYNKEYKIAIFNVKAAGANASTDYSTFSIAVRKYSDTNKRPVILETFSNLTLDPASPNYIKKVIGDQDIVIDENGKQTLNGDYVNRSKYIRVECVAEGSFPITAAPFAHGAYVNPIYVGANGTESMVPAVIFSTGSENNNSSIVSNYSGIDLETSVVKIDNSAYLSPIPASATIGGNTAFSFDAAFTAIVGGVVSTKNFGYTLSTSDDSSTINKRQFIVGFQEGFDGCSPTTEIALAGSSANFGSGNTQGFNCSTSTSSGSVAYVKAINAVSNPDDFDINLVSAPGIVRRHHSYVFDKIVDMVEAREDAFFIGDVVGVTYSNGQVITDTISQATEQAASVDSNYVGTYYPWVKTIDSRTNKLTSVPPSVLMPGIFAANDAVAAEWFAPAGLNRGGIIGAVSVLNRLTHSERDTLYEGKVNPIAQFPGEGIVAFGQKTLQDKSSALDRINVRRLLIKVKKYIASTSRYLVFEQNTSETRSRFLNTVNPYLEGIQQRQGLYAFKVVMDETNNTPDVIDRNILAGQIYLQPTKTAEFIVLDFNILPTGASFTA